MQLSMLHDSANVKLRGREVAHGHGARLSRRLPTRVARAGQALAAAAGAGFGQRTVKVGFEEATVGDDGLEIRMPGASVAGHTDADQLHSYSRLDW